MADISTIKIPNGSSYLIKDKSAVSSVTKTNGELSVSKRGGGTATTLTIFKLMTLTDYNKLGNTKKSDNIIYFVTE